MFLCLNDRDEEFSREEAELVVTVLVAGEGVDKLELDGGRPDVEEARDVGAGLKNPQPVSKTTRVNQLSHSTSL